ncbi:MAG: hypothetical protein E5W15_12870 [Mesorhizobium sp.]|nr:hypothetical protein EN856_08700 [Mesorhizobium sp. M8A.F.Ca.ET.213.01.1.1]TIT52156.1 MAG: hypothetical protein E5W75_05730 [Mesorhizobium sp.]TIU71283.1 MAG: hypothetical protein E5W15_12870 [Mesorhizobium sp.]TIW18685.1 MAG: hypothetical protein E5V81_17290 [Mesorhizobium sp.]
MKSRTALTTALWRGVARSEAVSLKAADVDSDRMVTYASTARPPKDLTVMLSPQFLGFLRTGNWQAR